jgi:hypothetical protein
MNNCIQLTEHDFVIEPKVLTQEARERSLSHIESRYRLVYVNHTSDDGLVTCLHQLGEVDEVREQACHQQCVGPIVFHEPVSAHSFLPGIYFLLELDIQSTCKTTEQTEPNEKWLLVINPNRSHA